MTKPPVIETRAGHAGYDSQRFQGYSVLDDLLGRESYATQLGLACSGRRITRKDERAVLDAVAVVFSVGDPRIWPIKIAQLGAAYGNPAAGFTASNAVMYEAAIGPAAMQQAASLLVEVSDALGPEPTVSQTRAAIDDLFATRSAVIGFGVAFRPVDERAVALRQVIRDLSRNRLRYFRLYEQIADYVENSKYPNPNIALCMAAALLDLKLTLEQVWACATAATFPIILANALESAGRQSPALRKLGRDFVDDKTPPPRRSPRFAASRKLSSS